MPPDSFEVHEIIPSVDDSDAQDTPPVADPSTTVPPLLPAPDIYQAAKLLRQRLYKGEPQYEVQWKDSRETTWEPVENILDKRLITKYYEDHPRAKNLLTATAPTATDSSDTPTPTIAAFSLSPSPTTPATHPFVATSSDQVVVLPSRPAHRRLSTFQLAVSSCFSLPLARSSLTLPASMPLANRSPTTHTLSC